MPVSMLSYTLTGHETARRQTETGRSGGLGAVSVQKEEGPPRGPSLHGALLLMLSTVCLGLSPVGVYSVLQRPT